MYTQWIIVLFMINHYTYKGVVFPAQKKESETELKRKRKNLTHQVS